MNQSPPTIAGEAQPGQTLTEGHGAWSNSPTSYSYQWFGCNSSGNSCRAIAQASHRSYTVRSSDVGRTIRVQETARNSGGTGKAKSMPVGPVAANASSTSLALAPARAVTNQIVTLAATVTSSSGSTRPVGTVTFTDAGVPLAGCANLRVTAAHASVTVTCQAAFSAAASPAHLAAVFRPSAGSGVGGSASPTVDLGVGQDGSSTALDISNPTVAVGSSATYTATVGAGHPGAFRPSGQVQFLDNGQPIPSCVSQPVAPSQSAITAQCTVRYDKSAQHTITARYLGDANFVGSTSATVNVSVHRLPNNVRGIIKSKTHWVFRFTPSYTRVLSFVIHQALAGMTVGLRCRGSGCPFAPWSTAVAKTARCHGKRAHACARRRLHTVNLSSRLRRYRLRPGSVITVRFTRPQWIGKEYRFSIRAAHAPGVQILCVAPGAQRAGLGC